VIYAELFFEKEIPLRRATQSVLNVAAIHRKSKTGKE